MSFWYKPKDKLVHEEQTKKNFVRINMKNNNPIFSDWDSNPATIFACLL